jgi:hypothetical protein
MNANEITLNATLDTSQDESDMELEAEFVPIEKWTRKNRNMYLGKLRLLGTIHAKIADKLNEKRKATFEAFFMAEDKWFPESNEKDLLIRLALDKVIATPETMPSEV